MMTMMMMMMMTGAQRGGQPADGRRHGRVRGSDGAA